jgi:hypothetical protein
LVRDQQSLPEDATLDERKAAINAARDAMLKDLKS